MKKVKKTRPATFGSVLVHSGTTFIEPCDGTQTLAQLPKAMTAYLDLEYKKFGLDCPQKETQKTRVDVYTIINDATFAQMFGSPDSRLDALCLTQHQIKAFCENRGAFLGESGTVTFFLFKFEDQFFVVEALVHTCGLFLRPYKLNDGQVWRSVHSYHLVVPAQVP